MASDRSLGLPTAHQTEARTLTQQQRRCVELAGEGLSSKQIGRVVSLSSNTVDYHIKNAIKVLGVSNRAEAGPLYSRGLLRSQLCMFQRFSREMERRRQWRPPPVGQLCLLANSSGSSGIEFKTRTVGRSGTSLFFV